MSDSPNPSNDIRVADAAAANWVDTHAPVWARPYLRLARADRPIGTWLLLIPSWWGLAWATVSQHGSWTSFGIYAALFALGAFVMRGAGCTYNDIVDRDFDAKVERTRSRPIPAGQVSVTQAWVFLFAQAFVGLAVLLTLSPFAIKLGLASLVLVAIYPFMKRVTYWPQAWLGLTFNWGVLMGYAALTNTLTLTPLLVYLGAIFWTLGYDTIYAHQDKEDDAFVGVKSTALKFGESTRLWLYVFYGMTALCLFVAGMIANFGTLYFLGLGLGAVHLFRQVKGLNTKDSTACLETFKSNRDFGYVVLAAILVAGML
ncbi:MAG: 4-hydroxybenzoate octaprenyltransferase [Alphaproteobacteria bacterium]|nr:MAG: 4-hydroxybenzoate octaprenyltransferase [Alphaproteobacteria bacterium]